MFCVKLKESRYTHPELFFLLILKSFFFYPERESKDCGAISSGLGCARRTI